MYREIHFYISTRWCRRVVEYRRYKKYISVQYYIITIHSFSVCAVAADAFSDNESDDRRKWRLDAKIQMSLKKG